MTTETEAGLGVPESTTGADKLISVVTVCRNAEATIETTLQSVAMQKNRADLLEHIVVDGASADNTLAIVKRYPGVRWISEPDDGIADAFNKGMHLARGQYVLYLNADDYLYDATVIDDVAAFVQSAAAPAWIVGDVLASRDGEITFPKRRYPPSCWSLMLRNRINHQSMFLSRQVLLAAGGFEKRFKIAMDYDLFERLCATGIEPTYFPRIVSVFSEHGLSSVVSPALVSETREVAGRFRNNPVKRFIGHVYDQLRGGF